MPASADDANRTMSAMPATPAVLRMTVPRATVSAAKNGVWALQVAGGQPASMLTLAGWAIAMVALAILAKLGFDRQEL